VPQGRSKFRFDDPEMFLATRPGGRRRPNLFSALDDEVLASFKAMCSKTKFETGQLLFSQEDEHSYIYIIIDGLIQTYYVAQTGREVTLGYWSAGDLVGGPDIFGGNRHVWSAVAVQPSKALAIAGPALQAFALVNPSLSNWLVDALGFKLRWLSVLFQIQGTDRVEDRLAKLLLLLGEHFGERQGKGVLITTKISQSNLGSMVGASRQWTNRALRRMHEKGLLEFQNRFMLLSNPDAIREQLHANGSARQSRPPN
jgi:CRP/FNR family transcriptional regulator, cyclic AMP receptor protein